jgi:thiol-disulfide isomerase/thioredoxin
LAGGLPVVFLLACAASQASDFGFRASGVATEDQASDSAAQASDPSQRAVKPARGQGGVKPPHSKTNLQPTAYGLQPANALPVGSPMVDFGLKRLDAASGEVGEIVWLSDFVGNKDAKTPKKALLLNFFATWCEPCKAELPVLVELHRKYAGRGLQVLSINYHDEDDEIGGVLKKSVEIIKKFSLPFPVLVDRYTNRNQLVYMGSKAALPCNVIIDANGVVASRFQGGKSATLEELEQAIVKLTGGAHGDEKSGK